MNPWLAAAAALLLGLVPCLIAGLRGGIVERLVSLEMAGTVVTLTLLLLAVGMGRSDYLDLSVALALLSFPGGLVFARFVERWM